MEELEIILSESIADASLRSDRTLRKALDSVKDVIVVGAGAVGRFVHKNLGMLNVCMFAFADNDMVKQGRVIDGMYVLSVEEAVKRFPDAVFMLSVHRECRGLREQLVSLGAKRIMDDTDLMICHWRLDHPRDGSSSSTVLLFREDILNVFGLLHDQESRDEFLTQIKLRMNLPVVPKPHLPTVGQYFPDDIFKTGDDFFVDCGAYNGDTIQELLLRSNPPPRKIVAIEADPGNYSDLWENTKELSVPIFRCNAAVASRSGRLRFSAGKGQASCLSSSGDIEVQVNTLDNILIAADKPTFIKMDIEGSEINALWGGENVIKKSKPILAVCAYHETNHIWDIPLVLHQLLPDHKLFLRRYSQKCWENVYYAVPPKRCLL